jgi:hypothetical protein
MTYIEKEVLNDPIFYAWYRNKDSKKDLPDQIIVLIKMLNEDRASLKRLIITHMEKCAGPL